MTSSHSAPERLLPWRSLAQGSQARDASRVLLLVAITACGGGEERAPLLGSGRSIPGCEGFGYRPCDILAASCQRELYGLAACLYGDGDPGEPPPVLQLDEAGAIALLSETPQPMAMTDGRGAMSDPAVDEAAFRAEVRGLELIGLLDPGSIERPADVVDATLQNTLAFYLVSKRQVVVIDRGEPADDLDANGVLAHEFVHALQDRRHDLGSFGADLALDSDGSLARSSLIEGEASIYQYLLLFAYSGSDVRAVDFRRFFRDLTTFGLELTLEAGSPALSADSIFPYTFGTRYTGERWMDGGSAALDGLYGAPPRSSWEVLGGDASTVMASFPQGPEPLDGHATVSANVAGAWVSVAMLAGLPGASDVAGELPELASRWRGDRFWIYESPQAGVATLWAIEWSSPDAARRFAELAAALAPAGASVRIDTTGSSTRITAVERADDVAAWQERLGGVVP